MGTFLDLLSDSFSVLGFLTRMHSTAFALIATAPNIAPTKNYLKGDIFNLDNNLLKSLDISGFGVLLFMARLLVSYR